jgi:hypothetical protein
LEELKRNGEKEKTLLAKTELSGVFRFQIKKSKNLKAEMKRFRTIFF